jgi:flavin-dependent dehydrogenase
MFASLASKKYKVLLADKREMAKPFTGTGYAKTCGGLIAPDAQRVIARLGLGVPLDVLAGPQLFAVNSIDSDSGLQRLYQRHYINIDREKFDRWLASRVSSADTIYGALFRNYEEQGNIYKVSFSRGEKDIHYLARNIVSAEGASSLVRKKLFGTYPPGCLYASIQDRYRIESPAPCYYAIFNSKVTDFYSWIIPKDGCIHIGSALKPGPDAVKKFEQFKAGLSRYGFSLPKKFERSGAMIVRPQSSSVLKSGIGRIALTGEAGGWISPSSAEGLSYAFESAALLFESVKDCDENYIKRYSDRLSSLRRNIFLKNLKSPFMYNHLLRNGIMRSGIMSLDRYNE